ncbi:MAG TPA: DUF2007 domain-containing protein [Blastocatellia bacterium]|jgi:hypothetical protein|nr:DUF2007 domain-containing protein [Blastocatellia bacterium]
MAFCPNCEAEYKEGITVCTDCNFELVPELTPDTTVHDKTDGEPVPFQSFKTSAEAEMAFNILEQNGIRAFVQGGDFAVIPSSFSQEVVIMVDERDMDRAVEVYEAYFDADSPAPASENQAEGEQ